MENILKGIQGVVDVKASLVEKKLGEAQILYDAAQVSLEDLQRAVPLVSGEKHKFVVISVEEG